MTPSNFADRYASIILNRDKHRRPSFNDSEVLRTLKRKEWILFGNVTSMPIPVTVRSKAWVCGNSNAGIVGSKPAGGTNVCLL